MAGVGPILLFPEDKDARVLERLVRHAARCADPDLETQLLEMENRRPGLGETPNLWRAKTGPGRRRRGQLVRQLIEHIQQGEDRLIVFHIDADAPWSRRPSTADGLLDDLLLEVARDADLPLARVQQQVLRAVPYWCIEAWTLQNLDLLARLKVPPGETPLPIEAWRADRRLLDEVPFPKSTLWTKDRHNFELVERVWPAAEVAAAGTSFAAFVEAWRTPAARALLARTHAPR